MSPCTQRMRRWGVHLLLLGGVSACAPSGEGLDANGHPLRLDDTAGIDTSDTSTDTSDTSTDTGDTGGPGAPTLTEIQDAILTPSCAKDGCHVVGIAPLGLVLSEGRSYSMLVGRTSEESQTMTLVVPGRSDISYLMAKIQPGDPRNLGELMPRDGPPYLDPDQIAMIAAWIDAGALDD